MTKKMYCKCCGKQFFAQRSTAKYCSGTCRARMSREKTNDFERDFYSAYRAIAIIRQEYFNDRHNPDWQVSALDTIGDIQHELNKMIAIIGTIESEQANTWYQCTNCGQRTFGKVDTCDFCGKSDFKPISLSKS